MNLTTIRNTVFAFALLAMPMLADEQPKTPPDVRADRLQPEPTWPVVRVGPLPPQRTRPLPPNAPDEEHDPEALDLEEQH